MEAGSGRESSVLSIRFIGSLEAEKQEEDTIEREKVEKIVDQASLTSKQLEAFETRLPLANIAREGGVSRQAVWKRKKRAQKRLKKSLGGLTDLL